MKAINGLRLLERRASKQNKMTIQISPISPSFGVQISAIDLKKDLDENTHASLRSLLSEYAVLVFPNQFLGPAELMKAGEIFGTLMPQQLQKYVLPDFPLVGYNSTKDLPIKNGKLQVRGENYHTDHSNSICPPKATALSAVNIPSSGGDTQFVDVRQSFDDLPSELQEKIIRLRSLHVHESSRSPRSFTKLSEEDLAKIPQVLQPLVIRHPSSKRPALYLNTGRMEGVEEMNMEEGFALINSLYEHSIQSKYEYRHRWAEGDFVIWDNRSVMHQANADYNPEEFRYLYRIMIEGDQLEAFSS
jgi:taurine dioxygenase